MAAFQAHAPATAAVQPVELNCHYSHTGCCMASAHLEASSAAAASACASTLAAHAPDRQPQAGLPPGSAAGAALPGPAELLPPGRRSLLCQAACTTAGSNLTCQLDPAESRC